MEPTEEILDKLNKLQTWLRVSVVCFVVALLAALYLHVRESNHEERYNYYRSRTRDMEISINNIEHYFSQHDVRLRTLEADIDRLHQKHNGD